MKRTILPVTEVEHNLSDLQWGLLYYQDDILLKKIENVGAADINSPKLLEAHLFGAGKEIHIFEYDGNFNAVLNEDDTQEQIVREYELIGRFKQAGEALVVRDYIAFDDDGMAYVEYSRPVKISGEGEKRCIQ